MNRERIINRFSDRPTPTETDRGDHVLNPGTRPDPPLTPAAVLVPLVDRPQGPDVLLTRRTDHLANHAGQISFPGGRIEAQDTTPENTALRETEEEIGLDRRHVKVIGRLDSYLTRTGFAITPVVAMVEPGFELAIDPFEVAEVFEVPLSFFLDSANHHRHSIEIEGRKRWFQAMPYGEYYIWGATAGMLFNLYELLTRR